VNLGIFFGSVMYINIVSPTCDVDKTHFPVFVSTNLCRFFCFTLFQVTIKASKVQYEKHMDNTATILCNFDQRFSWSLSW